jgi:hypothetical protein
MPYAQFTRQSEQCAPTQRARDRVRRHVPSREAGRLCAGRPLLNTCCDHRNFLKEYLLQRACPAPPEIRLVLNSVFSITFLLLLYAKHCKRGGRSSGVVESLPVFRFGALRGEEGLECAVCLGRFDPAEALRLPPKCRHGFHVECVDTWLDAHSTCPPCRARTRTCSSSRSRPSPPPRGRRVPSPPPPWSSKTPRLFRRRGGSPAATPPGRCAREGAEEGPGAAGGAGGLRPPHPRQHRGELRGRDGSRSQAAVGRPAPDRPDVRAGGDAGDRGRPVLLLRGHQQPFGGRPPPSHRRASVAGLGLVGRPARW